jgi:RNA polymerase sigma-70 factor (ECF subfamily)
LKLWQKPDLYNAERGAFSSWILTVVHHRAANDLRARRRLAPLPTPFYAPGGEESSSEETLVDPRPPVEEQVVLAEEQAQVRAALADLSPAQREVLELAYYGGMTQSEIAAHLGQPLGTVKTRVRSGLQKLRANLEHLSPPPAGERTPAPPPSSQRE